MNYNELDLAGPAVPTSSADIAANQVEAGKAGNLLGTINLLGCVGSACCSAGTKWDNEKSKCVPAPVDASAPTAAPANPATPPAPTVGGFTTMEQSGPIAHSPSEYDSYGRV